MRYGDYPTAVPKSGLHRHGARRNSPPVPESGLYGHEAQRKPPAVPETGLHRHGARLALGLGHGERPVGSGPQGTRARSFESLQTRHAKKAAFKRLLFARAENETRTRDPDLGKVVLYQLSYFRVSLIGIANVAINSRPANFFTPQKQILSRNGHHSRNIRADP